MASVAREISAKQEQKETQLKTSLSESRNITHNAKSNIFIALEDKPNYSASDMPIRYLTEQITEVFAEQSDGSGEIEESLWNGARKID